MSVAQPYQPARKLLAVNDGAADAPPGMNWQEAARLLLNTIGYYEDIGAARSPTELGRLLQGSGFALAQVELVNGIIPTAENGVGYLLEMNGGEWLPVLGGAEDAIILAPDARQVMLFEKLERDRILSAWVLSERIVDMNSVMSFLTRYRGHFLHLFVAAIVINLFSLMLPLFSSFVYDKILGNGIYETLWALVIGLLLVIGVEFCVRIVRVNVAERFSVGSELDIDGNIFRNLLNMSPGKMPRLGALLEKYKQVLTLRDFLSSSYILSLADLPFILLFLAAIAAVAGPLVLVAVVCGTLTLLTNLFFMPAVMEYDQQAKAAGERRFGLLTDVLGSREGVVGGAFQSELSRRWNQASVTAVTASSKARYWRGFGMTVTNSISFLSFISVLVGGVYMVEAHTLTAGGLLAASMLTSRTMGTFASVNTLIIRYREFRIALRELNRIVAVSAPVPKRSYGPLQGAIRVDKVTCRFNENEKPILGDISLAIAPGEIVGIAGVPGAGKTTLLRLLAGVLIPSEGKILIDNIPLQQLSPDDITSNIGFKPQDFCLLDGTIEDNVRAGRPAPTAEERDAILSVSGLGFAFQENGLHWATDIGPRGTNISGGQRQLVALARAFLTQPSVLLLDEPTNGLDTPLEAHLARQIGQMRGQSTILISTHSRTILSVCDRIIVVGQSRILANGPRDKILV